VRGGSTWEGGRGGSTWEGGREGAVRGREGARGQYVGGRAWEGGCGREGARGQYVGGRVRARGQYVGGRAWEGGRGWVRGCAVRGREGAGGRVRGCGRAVRGRAVRGRAGARVCSTREGATVCGCDRWCEGARVQGCACAGVSEREGVRTRVHGCGRASCSDLCGYVAMWLNVAPSCAPCGSCVAAEGCAVVAVQPCRGVDFGILSVHRELLRRPASMTTEASGRIYKNMYIFLRNLQKYVHLFSIQSTQALAKPLWLKGGAHSR
jgi:hypothetical protein